MDATSFPWELLPSSIHEEILSKLPISVLLRLRSISRSFLSSIRSLPPSLPFPRDPFFLLFSSSSSSYSISSAIVFQPSRNRWLSMPLPSFPATASGPLILLSDSLFNPFSGTPTPIPPHLPMTTLIYPLSLIIEDDGTTHRSRVRIVVVSTSDRIRSQIYDSASGSWTLRGELPGRVHMLGNAVVLNGSLYVLSFGPDHLLKFDLLSGDWEIVTEVVPSVACAHLVAFGGRLFLVAGVADLLGVMLSVKVWEFDWENWKLVCSMPDEIFSEFSGMTIMKHFHVCDGKGMVCFYSYSGNVFLILDLMDWRWWWPRKCPLQCHLNPFLGVAVEPNAEFLR
ncbi:F-box only protein 6-like [Dioscorea cayenensis subsp. rotundata]|uniref:F-box only protein 6-like n=1 Tax=Dioscorea cayennensis subsp. rotundata TaxID=55577 RepID=A0AB40B3G0_DIOCR|nr:F-box only protein 6-like [Dioscorea cayenensis subsp. rotundata]XP_039121111.1 F-box only protein 6-like [Dioscorea cayenensis subsp. rotundata]XP_039121112.1 F-box only protein 6-like [Dioscorea cayenensis subsp. rotundata]XP_039121113.1 F-box only protein 6-like [Dioscorea cayenensis subsp. rotundata]